MKTALALSLVFQLSIPTHIQAYTLQECRELEGIVHTVKDKDNQDRLACVFSDGEFAWLALDFKPLHE